MSDPQAAAPLPDKDIHVRDMFDAMARAYLLSVLSEDLIAEHRRSPPHMSEPLSRLVAWCQRRPLTEQYAVKAEADGTFRIISFSGRRGQKPAYASEQRFATLAEARHGAFLRHIQDLTGK
jgi:branched-chain amino acid transport system permease protein